VTEERPVRKGDEVADEGLGRLLALTDGVFAIALTLLVIQIALPEGTSDVRLGAALVALGPHYFAYVLSFAVIARFWIAHHLAFRYIRRYDDTLIWLNLLLLMFVGFLPFPTSVLGEHGNTPTGAAFYGAALVCTSAASGALGGTPRDAAACYGRTWTAGSCANAGSAAWPAPSISPPRCRSRWWRRMWRWACGCCGPGGEGAGDQADAPRLTRLVNDAPSDGQPLWL
jgi:hypothetical protein